MDFEEAKKIYIRFLKENGVYKNAIKKHCDDENGNKRSLSKALKIATPLRWVSSSDAFCIWSSSSEKDGFWWCISLLWQHECIQNKIYLNENDKKILFGLESKFFDGLKRFIFYFDDNFHALTVNSSIEHKELKKLRNRIFDLLNNYKHEEK